MNLFQKVNLIELDEFYDIKLELASISDIDELNRRNNIYQVIGPINFPGLFLSLSSDYSVISTTQNEMVFDLPVVVITSNAISIENIRNIFSSTLDSSELLAITDYQGNNIFYVIYPKNGFVFANY